jgi:hypothetical protein
MLTSGRRTKKRVSSGSQADAILATLSRPDGTLVSYPGGSPGSAWTQHRMALTRSAVQGHAHLSQNGNLLAVQLQLGHRRIEGTLRYLGIEVDDALAIAEQKDVWTTCAEQTRCAILLRSPSCHKQPSRGHRYASLKPFRTCFGRNVCVGHGPAWRQSSPSSIVNAAGGVSRKMRQKEAKAKSLPSGADRWGDNGRSD